MSRRFSSFWRSRQTPTSSETATPVTENTPLLGNKRATSYSYPNSSKPTGQTAPAVSVTGRSPSTSSANNGIVNMPVSSRSPGSSASAPRLSPSNSSLSGPTSRPKIARSATAAPTSSHPVPAVNHATPILSRPMATRAVTNAGTLQRPEMLRTRTETKAARPSLLRRATDILDLNPKTSYTHRNAPQSPSHWTDHAHRKPLLGIWDAVHAAASVSGYPKSITAQVVSTEKEMLQQFAELREGSEPLTREWIEYVLGVCLRHPFCTAENMGRFEVLAASGGARANWGPW